MADRPILLERDIISVAERLWPSEPMVLVGSSGPKGIDLRKAILAQRKERRSPFGKH